MLFRNIIFVFIALYQTSLAEVRKTISSNASPVKYVSYSINQQEKILILKNTTNYAFSYETKNFYLYGEIFDNLVIYKIKVIKDKNVYNLSWKTNEKQSQIIFSRELNPLYLNLDFSNACEPHSEFSILDLDFSTPPENVSEPLLKFSNECTSELTRLFGSDFRLKISREALGKKLWDDKDISSDIYNRLSNKNFLPISQEGLNEIKDRKKSLTSIKCELDKDCDKNASYSPVDDQIKIYPACIDKSKTPACTLASAINEEILHKITKVGNEQPSHNDVKLIAHKITPCNEYHNIQIDFDSTTRSDFNQQVKIEIPQKQIPSPPEKPEKLSQPFALDLPTERPRTVIANRSDMDVIGNIARPIKWARDAADAAIRFAESRSPSSQTAPRPAKNSSYRKNLDLLTTSASTTAQIKPKEALKLNKQSEDPLEISETPENPETPNKKQSRSNELAVRKSSTQPSSNANRETAAAFKANFKSTVATTQERRTSPERTTASIPPAQPVDSSKFGTELPDELKKEMRSAQIQSIPDLVSRLNDDQQRKPLLQTLKNKNISIVGLAGQTLGETDFKKAKYIYKYVPATKETPPKLINIKRNLPTNI